MRIDIITCHDVYNYGASLQAYALSSFLNTLGHDAEIIDYKPDYLSHHYEFGYVEETNRYYSLCRKSKIFHFIYSLRLLPVTFATWRRIKPFDRFKAEKLKCTKRYSDLKTLQKDPPLADMYIAGSDQIWNCNLPNGRDAAFFLSFGSVKRKISYAASFAMPSIPEKYVDMLKTNLANIDSISVREKSAVSLLANIGIKSTAVIDPVYLLSKEQWTCFAGCDRIIHEQYVFVYNLNHSNTEAIKKEALRIAKKFRCKIVAIDSSFKCRFSNINIHDAGPIEFVNLIRYSSFVVTDSFHGMSFALILQKPFSVWHKHSDSSRIYDLLNDIEAVYCINSTIEKNKYDWHFIERKIEDKVDNSINFIKINITLAQADER